MIAKYRRWRGSNEQNREDDPLVHDRRRVELCAMHDDRGTLAEIVISATVTDHFVF